MVTPPALRDRVDASLEALGVRAERVLVAVSGGRDSVVLLHVLGSLAADRKLELVVGTVDHGLRPEAAGDVAFAMDLARRWGWPAAQARVSPDSLRAERPSAQRPSRQESARRLRYDALKDLANEHGAGRIATAHHADDQAETVLLRLLRGTGPDGLGGIPEASPDGAIVRPLLDVSGADVAAYARGHDLVWREDASNQNLHYARNRLRHRWLPGLAREFNPRLLRTLAQLAEAHRRDAEWIEEVLREEGDRRLCCDGAACVIDRQSWEVLPTALARRLVHRAWTRVGGARHITRPHLERLCDFLVAGRSGAILELPGGVRARASRGSVRLEPATGARGRGASAC